jgi:DNA repair protein RadD
VRAPLITPYDFQDAAASALIAADGNPLADIATGGGKSVIIGEVCWRLDCTIVNTAPTQELVEQNEAAMRAVWPDAPVGVICAGLGRREYDAQIVIASINSIYQPETIQKLGPRKLVIIDEAHLVPHGEWGMYRQLLAGIQPQKVMGLTATPWRLQTGRLDEGDDRLFNTIAYEFGFQDGLNWRGPNGERILLPLIAKKTLAEIDVRGVTIRHGEYVESELEKRANADDVVEQMVDETLRYGVDRRKWLVFCCGVDHAEHVAQVLRQRNVKALSINGDTPDKERHEIIEAYRTGDLQCLTGCQIFTTGFNVRDVDLIALASPTRSPGLYVQMCGRGSRYIDGKMNCLVLDFSGNVRRLGPVDDPNIPEVKNGEKADKDPSKELADEMKACHLLTHTRDSGHAYP